MLDVYPSSSGLLVTVDSGDEYSTNSLSIAGRCGCLGPSRLCRLRGFRGLVADEMARADPDSSAGGLLGGRYRTFRLDLPSDAV